MKFFYKAGVDATEILQIQLKVTAKLETWGKFAYFVYQDGEIGLRFNSNQIRIGLKADYLICLLFWKEKNYQKSWCMPIKTQKVRIDFKVFPILFESKQKRNVTS